VCWQVASAAHATQQVSVAAWRKAAGAPLSKRARFLASCTLDCRQAPAALLCALRQRCACQRRALELHHAADGSGVGPLGVINGFVAAGSSRAPSGFGLVRLCMAHVSYQQIWAEYRVSMCQCDLSV